MVRSLQTAQQSFSSSSQGASLPVLCTITNSCRPPGFRRPWTRWSQNGSESSCLRVLLPCPYSSATVTGILQRQLSPTRIRHAGQGACMRTALTLSPVAMAMLNGCIAILTNCLQLGLSTHQKSCITSSIELHGCIAILACCLQPNPEKALAGIAIPCTI